MRMVRIITMDFLSKTDNELLRVLGPNEKEREMRELTERVKLMRERKEGPDQPWYILHVSPPCGIALP